MYSHEIEELLRVRNNLVTVQEYLEICKSSQVNCVKYNAEKNNFEIHTKDNYHFILKIERRNK